MAKNASLFSPLSGSLEYNIYVVDDYVLTIARSDDVESLHGRISNVYHVPRLSANLLSISQLTSTVKIVEFWSDKFIVRDHRLGWETIDLGHSDPKYGIYKFCDSP